MLSLRPDGAPIVTKPTPKRPSMNIKLLARIKSDNIIDNLKQQWDASGLPGVDSCRQLYGLLRGVLRTAVPESWLEASTSGTVASQESQIDLFGGGGMCKRRSVLAEIGGDLVFAQRRRFAGASLVP